jgi:predicted regulator of Ras-like GTPase activity (Roadblock/LC7/MglB family)
MLDRSRGLVGVNEKQRMLQAAVDNLVARKGILGAMLVRRDGISIMHRGRQQINPETFGAMCAVAVGAAETAFSELGPPETPQIRAETSRHRLLIMGATDEVILVVIGERTVDWNDLGRGLTEATEGIGKILSS